MWAGKSPPIIFKWEENKIMNITNTVENRALQILKECPETRNDDMLLFFHYYNRFGCIRAGALPLSDIAYNYKAYGLPCFETIRRARQRVQSLLPEFSRKDAENDSVMVVINIS